MTSYRIEDMPGRIKRCLSDRTQDPRKPAALLTETDPAADRTRTGLTQDSTQEGTPDAGDDLSGHP
jgi:hypothetical protein